MRAALLLAIVLPAPACPLPEPALRQGVVQLAWTAGAEAIAVGRHFALELQVCPEDTRLVRVDATMPEHRHGMNYRPSLAALGGGRWRAEGLMFHMPGRWQLRFDVVDAGGGSASLLDDVTLR